MNFFLIFSYCLKKKKNVCDAKNDKIYYLFADKTYWTKIGTDILRTKLNTERQFGLAKNVIFFLGDGMSTTTLTAARIYMGQLANKTGESEMLSFEKFPYTGLSKVNFIHCTTTATQSSEIIFNFFSLMKKRRVIFVFRLIVWVFF